MTVTFRSGDIVIEKMAGPITVGLGRKFSLLLDNVRPGRIRWTTENDPILDLREADDRLSARVTATDLGVGIVYINNGIETFRLKVTVVPMNDTTNEAVTLNGSIGPEIPDK